MNNTIYAITSNEDVIEQFRHFPTVGEVKKAIQGFTHLPLHGIVWGATKKAEPEVLNERVRLMKEIKSHEMHDKIVTYLTK